MTDREHPARALASRVLGVEPERFIDPFVVFASPAWRGIEGEIWRAEAAGRAVIVKCYHPDTAIYAPPVVAIEAARNAGALGIAPKVPAADESAGLVAFEALCDGWHCGGPQEPVAPEVRAATITAKKAFRNGPALSRSVSIFDGRSPRENHGGRYRCQTLSS